MRKFISCTVALLVAAGAARAQSWRIGVAGGVALGTPASGYSEVTGGSPGGWGAGLAFGYRDDQYLALRIDAGFGALGGADYCVGGLGCAYIGTADYAIGGASASALWHPIGDQHTVSPYLIAGIGWYAVRGSTTLPVTEQASSSTLGTPGYSAGIGVSFSRFFVQGEFMQIAQAPVAPYWSKRQSLYSVPVTVGYWF